MSSFDDMRSKRAIAYAWYGCADGKNDEFAAEHIGIRSSMFTLDEANKDENELNECKPG